MLNLGDLKVLETYDGMLYHHNYHQINTLPYAACYQKGRTRIDIPSDSLLEITERFEALQHQQRLLCNALTVTDARLPAWDEQTDPRGALNSSTVQKIRSRISQHIGNFWHHEDKTLRMPGLVACSLETLALLQALNYRKSRFEQYLVQLRKALAAPGATLPAMISTASGKRSEEIDALLTDAGMRGINLTLCYRRLHQLPDSIESVSWTWSRKSRSVKSLTVPEAIKLVNKHLAGTAAQESALGQLGRLPPKTPLAVARPVQTALKANITFEDTESRTVRKLITAHSPLFYRDTDGTLPRKHWPGYPDENVSPRRLHRQQRYLESEPYIRALNLYRYLESESENSP